jgi:cytochrome b561
VALRSRRRDGRVAEPSYHPAAQALHWVTALAVLGMLGVGLWMTGLPLGFTKLYAYTWHKWVGLVVLVLTAGRLLWRWRHPPPPLPAAVVRWQAVLAPIAHWALLVLLLAMPISGWLMSSAAGVSVFWFGYIPLPDLVPRDPALFDALRTTHYILSRLLIAVLVLHVAAVVHHDVLRRDGVFRRMWPFGGT